MENKRAELHLHTKLSDDISVISVKEIFEKAENLGIEAVAFTNLSNVQDFYEIARYAKKSNVKAIYGAELFYKNENGICGQKLTLLAKNQVGIKELYKVISSIENDGICDLIDLSVLKRNRKNLLVGSCGYDGELFYEIATGGNIKKIEKIAALYDYFEIFPARNELEKEINKKIFDLGTELGVPVVAVNNAHYLLPEDYICRDIVRASYGFDPQRENHLYLRSTCQMLDEFDYLGKNDAQDAVINAPRLISDLICPASPLKEGFYMVAFPNAYGQIKNLAFNRAYEIYGNPLPEAVQMRINDELALIDKNDFASFYLIAHKLVKYVTDRERYVGVRGATGSSFVTFLLGISNVNPLPPHYYCPECHYFEASDSAQDGFDLSKKECPRCKAVLKTDGHNIPYETFMGFDGSRMPDFDINISSDMKLSVIEYMQELFDKSKIAMAGTVCTLVEYIAQKMLDKYEIEQGASFTTTQRDRIISLLEGVKKNDGVHPGGIMIIPKKMDFEDFTPLKKNWAPIDATHLDFHNLYDTILKTDILCPGFVDFLELLQKTTGVKIAETDVNDPKIFEYFKTTDTKAIPEFDTNFMRDLLIKTKPETFSDLVKLIGLAHGTNVWCSNGENLIKKGIPLSKLPTTRDDIVNDLISIGVDRQKAFEMGEIVRKGIIAKNKISQEIITHFKEISKPLGEWYFEFCSKVRYMFPKAHAVSYATVAIYCAWYKKYYLDDFYKADSLIE
ncbi:MAG: PHP domain-containing protein [Clostridia bacterium]|nr:PHP domain-containing protein [Clostridia bacterium]